MEDGLRDQPLYSGSLIDQVLILVLMEDGLRDADKEETGVIVKS